MYKVFISHSVHDKKWVEWIAANATNIGIETYLYEQDVQPGISIRGKVQQNIKDCDALLVLLTTNSHFSPYVQQEIGYAEAFGKLIIPLVQPGIEEQSLAMLVGREYVPFDFQNANDALASTLQYLSCLRCQKEKKEDTQNIIGAGLVLMLLINLLDPE